MKDKDNTKREGRVLVFAHPARIKKKKGLELKRFILDLEVSVGRDLELAVVKSDCCCCQVASVVSDSVRPHRRQPTRLPHPWDSPGKNTGVGCHFLLQCMKVKSESEVITRVGRPRIRSKDGGGNAILQMLHFYRKTCPTE